MTKENYKLETDYIELYALLKIKAPIGSGGEAKHIISEERVTVDGVVETRKKCKIRAGQLVKFEDLEIAVS
ncbi:RNA-binding protein [Candidatus Marinamargulisbacteria bacterium SCGC AAA071-K20]|nr:RNA-binding protein [Candidatus Marinamargulisbacteria bacterium SCGC AAA071-K20]